MTEGKTGYEMFLDLAAGMRRDGLPDTAKEWEKINPGYRRLVARQAGLTQEEMVTPLHKLSNDKRRAMRDANAEIVALAEDARRVLMKAVIPLA